jgi:hypothetical protein
MGRIAAQLEPRQRGAYASAVPSPSAEGSAANPE